MKKVRIFRSFSYTLFFYLSLPFLMLLVLGYKFSSKLIFLTLCLSAIIYLVTAILHHLKDKSLNLEIIIEYFLIAFLALVILQGSFI